jgi:hypothetical protein
MNKVNTNETLSRMKSLMNYGLQTEGKQAPYSAVEYQKVGADGKVYGIVREGTKYYIKTAPNKQNLLKEDFGYIGGFRNRKENEYGNFALAQKQFDLKMMSLKEAANNPNFNVESWDLNKKEMVVTEASDKMKGEILRERQIMKNAMLISEKKMKECGDMPGIQDVQKGNIEDCNNIEKGENAGHGPGNDKTFSERPKDCKGAIVCNKDNNGKLVEGEVLGWNRNKDYMDKKHGTKIGPNDPFIGPKGRDIDDQDKNVTNTGEMKNGVVENHGTSMHDTDNQNKPSVGVGEGPSDDNNKPFDGEKGKQIDEALDGLDGGDPNDMGGEDAMGDDQNMGDDAEEMGGEDPGMDGAGEPVDTDALEGGDGLGAGDDLGDEDLDDEGEYDDLEDEDPIEDDLEDRISDLEDIIYKIADKLGVDTDVDAEDYEDDDLFGDEEGDEDFEDEYDDYDDEDEYDDEDYEDYGDEDEYGEDDLGGTPEDEDEYDYEDEDEDEYPMESRRRKGVQIIETKAFKRAMRKQRLNEEGMTPFTDNGRVPSGNMNKLDDFGKHPAYQKVVMTLPPKDMQEFPGNYDMNDDSVRNDNPYGEKIGDGAPFDIDPESIDNAIAESFRRLKRLKKG